MIIKRIGFSQFTDEFHNAGRGEQFSYTALSALYDYLMVISEGMGEPIELDVIGLCCEFTEESIGEYAENYDIKGDACDVVDHAMSETTVVYHDADTILYASY